MKKNITKIALTFAGAMAFAQQLSAQNASQIFTGATSQLRTLVDPVCTLLQVVLAVVCLFYSVLNAKKAMGGDHDAQNAIAKVLAYGAAGFILLYVFKSVAGTASV